jgi:uncharacterized protein YgiM (DUF1202 family)
MYGVGQSPPRRRGFIVIIGVVVLALILVGLFFAFYSLVLKEDTEAPSSTQEVPTTAQVVNVTDEPSPPATTTATSKPATATALPTIPATITPQPTITLRPPPEVITIGVRARVNISDGLAINLRDLPTLTGSTVITLLEAGSEVDVIDGPEDEGDLRWWNVDGSEGKDGWVVEAYGGETWLVPVGWAEELPPLLEPTPTPTATATAAAPEATSVVTPTTTPTLQPTATTEITPTATSVLTPTATPEGGIPSPTVNGRVRVTTKYQFVNLRANPGLSAESVGQLQDGTIATVVEGPEEADGLNWWKVDDGQENVGWAAERVGGEVLLVPIP